MNARSRTLAVPGLAVGLTALLVLPLVATAATPQGVAGTHVAFEISGPEGPQALEMWHGPDNLRMDLNAQGNPVSVIYSGGDMMMVMHSQRQYMLFSKEMMEQMAGMMGQMGQQEAAGGEAEFDASSPPTFTRTGNTETVGAWEAYEVEVSHADQTGDVTIWFSEDVDIDLVEFATQMAESMESLQNPMFQRMSGGGGPDMGDIAEIRAQLPNWNLPDGFPVRIVTVEDGQTTTITLTEIDQGTLPASTFAPPEGYEKMEMPFRR